MSEFSIRKGSTARSIRAALSTSNSLDDLSGVSSVKFYMARLEDGTVKINGAAAVIESVTASKIMVRYDWSFGDVDMVDTYKAYWKVTYANSKTDIFPSQSFNTISITDTF